MNELTIAQPEELIAAADEHVDAWHAHLADAVKQGDITAATESTYKAGMRRFKMWMETLDEAGQVRRMTGARTVADFKIAMRQTTYTDAAKNVRELSPASVNVWLAGVRSFYAWTVEQGLLPYNPARDVKGAKRHNANKVHKRDRLTDAEAARLLALQLAPRDRAILALKLYAALRDVEVQRADLRDIRTMDGRKVLMIHGKGHAEADDFVVLNPALDNVLAAWIAERGDAAGPLVTSASDRNPHGRLSLSAIRAIVKAAFRQAGITESTKTSHSCRHTAITKAALAAGVGAAQRLARHSDPQTTMIYVHEARRLENPVEDMIAYSA